MTEKRRYFIVSVGKPGKGYDEDNLIRCIEYNCHAMHRDTKQKGVFKDVAEHSICFLKFKDNLIGYGEVKNTSTKPNEDFDEWNWIIEVNEWIFYDKKGKRNGISNYGVSDEVIGGSQMATIKEIKQDYALQKMNEIDSTSQLYKQIMSEINYTKKVDLLTANKNLILTGAPGTGKTYLAKEIAEAMGATESNGNLGFVQFHPSYDYTDFVEGLRPTPPDENVNIGFERKDGVFKEFCKKALKATQTDGVDNFEDAWNKLVEKLDNDDFIIINLLSNKGTFKVELNEYGTGLANRTYDNDVYKKDNWISGKSKFFSKDQLYNVYRGIKGTPSGGHDNYRKAIVEEMKNSYGLLPYKKGEVSTKSPNPFVFIIDEINRGEISKIFGELFFSIDPSYRGEKGKVQTQYANLIDDGDVFKEGFFVPDNVYIIGTMNDIDRSVESFDFAMRRRFTWKEITAKDSQKMFDKEDGSPETWKDEAIKRMDAINDVIWKDKDNHIEGLNSSFHIGGAYFKNNLPKHNNDFGKVWEYHIKPLLKEYLRGMPDAESKLEKLENAYNGQ